MPKTKAEVAKMVRVNKTKQYSKLSTEQQQAKYKSIMESPRKDTAVAKIELSVLRKLFLASKKSAKKTTVVPKPAPKKPAPAPKKPAPKKTPAPTKDSLQAIMGIMAQVGKEKSNKTDLVKLKETLNNYSRGQLAKAAKQGYEDMTKGRTLTIPRAMTKDRIIDVIIERKINAIKFLTKKAKAEPKASYTIEGFGLIDDDPEEGDDGLPFFATEYGFEISNMYPSGLVALEAKLTSKQLKDFIKENEDDLEEYSRFFKETKKKGVRTRLLYWDGLSS